MGILVGVITFVLILIALALIGLILLQRGKGGGLAAFGGGAEQAFGTHAATLAQKATAVMSVLFLLLTIALGLLWNRPTTALPGPLDTTPSEGAPVGERPVAPAPAPASQE